MTPFDRPWSPQDIANAVTAGGTATSPGGTSHATKVLEVVGGQTGTAFQDVYVAKQLYTFTTANAAATGTAVTGLGAYKHAVLYAKVTLGTGTTPTLDLFVDSRLDGTNWVNISASQHITTLGDYASFVQKALNQDAVEAWTDISADAGAGSTRPFGWGDDMRVRIAITGTTPSFTGAVWAILVR